MCGLRAVGAATNSLFLSSRPALSPWEYLLWIFISLVANGSRFATYISKMNSSNMIAFESEA